MNKENVDLSSDKCNIGTAATSGGITMESETLEDENWAACNDLAVEDILDINDVEEICTLYERVENKSRPVSAIAESQELIN